MTKRIKSFDKFSGNYPVNKGIENGSTKTIIKTQLPFGISSELFWTIFTAIVAVSFFLGFYFGRAQFDKDKSDFYEENKNLKSELDKMTSVIEKLNKQIKSTSFKTDTVNTAHLD